MAYVAYQKQLDDLKLLAYRVIVCIVLVARKKEKNNLKMCLGTVQFGLSYGVAGKGKPHKQDSLEMLSYAFDKGVTCFDTAAAYGDAEVILGEFLASKKRGQFEVVTKTNISSEEVANADCIKTVLIERLKKSLEHLGLRYVDSLMVHHAPLVHNEMFMNSLKEVLASGLAKRVGVSIYTPEEALKSLEYDFLDDIQIPYNLADRRLDDAGFFAKSAKKTIFSRSAFLQGLLLMSVECVPTHLNWITPYLRELDALCRQEKVERKDVCISYIFEKKGIDYLVFGVDTKEQLDEALAVRAVDASVLKKAKNIFDGLDSYYLNPTNWKK